MGPIGWLLTCLLFTSAISAREFPKKAHPAERTDALAIATPAARRNETSDDAAPAFPPSTHLSNLLEHGNEFESNLKRNTSLLRQVEKDGEKEEITGHGEARTFGHKRIQFMLMPLMYKMGVMMTLLTVLTIISLKGLLIGAILLILKLATIVGKFTSGWAAHHAPAASPPSHGWSGPSNQPIHLHLHNSLPHGHSNSPYHAHPGAWIPPSEPEYSEPFDRSNIEHYYYKG